MNLVKRTEDRSRSYVLSLEVARRWVQGSSVPHEKRQDFTEDVAAKCAMAKTDFWAQFPDLSVETHDNPLIWSYVTTACDRENWKQADKRRKRNRALKFKVSDEVPSSNVDLAGGIKQREVAADIQAAIEDLEPIEETIFFLRYVEELSGIKIAEVTGKTCQQVDRIAQRARSKLAKHQALRKYKNEID